MQNPSDRNGSAYVHKSGLGNPPERTCAYTSVTTSLENSRFALKLRVVT